jgi:hypothetical protein
MREQLFNHTQRTATQGFAARRFLLLLPMFVLLAGSAFAQTTWTGGIDNAWDQPGNWSAGVPDADDDVTIPDVANDPVIAGGTAALARSVLVQAGGFLTINATGSLTINGSAAYNTPFTFDYTTSLNNLGTVTNNGGLILGSVSSVGSYGIVNQGTFNNNSGAEIQIDNATDTGLFNAFGTFTNAAAITIGATAAVGFNGMWNDAIFNNATGGNIQIDRSSLRGLMNNADEPKSVSATFTNSATITIGSSETVGKRGSIIWLLLRTTLVGIFASIVPPTPDLIMVPGPLPTKRPSPSGHQGMSESMVFGTGKPSTTILGETSTLIVPPAPGL